MFAVLSFSETRVFAPYRACACLFQLFGLDVGANTNKLTNTNI